MYRTPHQIPRQFTITAVSLNTGLNTQKYPKPLLWPSARTNPQKTNAGLNRIDFFFSQICARFLTLPSDPPHCGYSIARNGYISQIKSQHTSPLMLVSFKTIYTQECHEKDFKSPSQPKSGECLVSDSLTESQGFFTYSKNHTNYYFNVRFKQTDTVNLYGFKYRFIHDNKI